ncbi:HAMP domain-containing sensor histidine kinase [Flavobacteriaceae bacterium KMM 6897]|nr:HAMP domain-containing sensor histidine kinase [Flavobacteriaceae bacterium KMM 6897]
MKRSRKKKGLLQKASKAFFIISSILMLLSTVALYFYTRAMLENEIEEELRSTEARIETALASNKAQYSLPPVVEVFQVNILGKERIKDTLIYDPSQNEMENFRELSSFVTINDKNYNIIVRTLVLETKDILFGIVLSYVIILLFAFIFLFYFNKQKNKSLWQPFFNNLDVMKSFSLSSDAPIQLTDSDILEFSELNQEISMLTNKVRTDYLNLKQFTEDVSHELQTPLAIIQAKMENIINEQSITEKQYNQFTSIQKDIKRLTQLNRRLALLTKIDNHQFIKMDEVTITDIVKECVQNFKELSPLPISFQQENKIQIQMDPYLANVLCNNLISNAIKYSKENKGISIIARGNSLTIANFGDNPLIHPEKLFNRFYRESEGIKSTGLGLAIVKKICDLYGIEISYSFQEQSHIFQLDFQK